MKYNFLIAFCILFSTSFSQSIGNKYSTFAKEIASKKEMSVKDVLCSSEYGVYFYQLKEGVRSIVLLNNQGDISAEVTVEDNDKNKGAARSFKEAYVLDQSLYVVYTQFVQNGRTNYMIIDKYDAQTLEAKGNSVTAEENYPGKKMLYWYGIGAFRAMGELGEIDNAISPNQEYMAYYTSEYTKRGRHPDKVKVAVYDASGNQVWSVDKILKHESKLVTLLDMRVSDSGYVYIMADIASKDSESVKRKILSFKDGGKAYKELAMPRELNSLEGSAWNLLPNGFFEIYGYTRTKGGSVTGYELIVYDPYTKTVVERNGGQFSPDLVKMYMSKKGEKKKDKQAKKEGEYGLDHLVARELIKLDDGSAFLVGEQYAVVTTTTYYSKGGSSSRTSYFYGDIVVVKIDKDGGMIWEAKIPKFQYGGLTTYFSYYLSVCNDELNFFFNDRPGNCDPNKEGKLDVYRGLIDDAQTHIFNISRDGKLTNCAIPRENDKSIRFKMKNIVSLPNCGTFILEDVGGTYRARFVFQEI